MFLDIFGFLRVDFLEFFLQLFQTWVWFASSSFLFEPSNLIFQLCCILLYQSKISRLGAFCLVLLQLLFSLRFAICICWV